MKKDKAVKGDWNAICDVCGFKFKASKIKERWDGLYVCREDFETRHPSDYYRSPVGEESKVPWTSPEGTDNLVDVTFPGSTSTPLPSGNNNGNL